MLERKKKVSNKSLHDKIKEIILEEHENNGIKIQKIEVNWVQYPGDIFYYSVPNDIEITTVKSS